MSLRSNTLLVLCFGLLLACQVEMPIEVVAEMDQLPTEIDFNIHVKPILSDRCFACHGPDEAKRKAGLRLDQAEAAYAPLPDHPNKVAIKPGSLQQSELFHRILSSNPSAVMPPPESGLALNPREKAILIAWLKQGGAYEPHWAFQQPQSSALPKVKQGEWVQNPIDQYILASLEQKAWTPSDKADKETLLRRLSFDLTGLPPSIEEMDAFLMDDHPEAYEQVVDRLLASPHFGERMATEWMDLARYADSHGYTVDRFRDMSPWRDWVIKAFNDNMPYDQFVSWQLAGDLFPNPSKEQILATGFNRNHQQNMEGGIVEEEFRVEYVADRTNTLGTAFLGLTVECARCHDHKFDPISQKNYYELFSFFNNVKEAGQISWDNAMPVPTLLLSDEKVDSIAHFINTQIEDKEAQLQRIEQSEMPAIFQQWMLEQRPLLSGQVYPEHLVAHFNLDEQEIYNSIHPRQKGVMRQQHVSTPISPIIQAAKAGNGLHLDGDAWLDLGAVGVYDRHQPFSIGMWVNLPKKLENGVLFHKGIGAALYNFRGYHLALKDKRLQILMAHSAPYNAIIEYADQIPRDQWIHLVMTYDGSSTAAGLKLHLNGAALATSVDTDQLYKSILFQFEGQAEAGLQIGARWRGIGAKGASIDEITVFDAALTSLEVLQLYDKDRFQALLQQPMDALSESEVAQFRAYYLAHHSSSINNIQEDIQDLRQRYNSTLDSVQEIMVMQEMENPRQSYILDRGLYNMPLDSVYPTTPEAILRLPENFPKNRLGLANWLFHEDHPLTARVAVNRLWQQFFGQGLVGTPDDFGNQGALPSHPELLDWLALAFQQSAWDLKKMIKLLVMAASYQQASQATAEMMEQDPENRYLARGPSQRLSAEMIRDNALSASGLLVEQIGGKSVYPYQPQGLWRINGSRYQQDTGEKLYRRSLYTMWKRTVPNPTQATFDAPDRANCTIKRQETSTPLQALVLLNDPIFVETSRLIGYEISKASDNKKGIQAAFRKLTGRRASEQELNLLLELQTTERMKFNEVPNKMAGWLNTGDYQLNLPFDKASLAANTVVASTIINADATIVKR